MAEFSQRLKEALNMNNMSAAELCRRTGTPESVMSQYKSGKYVAKQKRLEQFAAELGVSPSWLAGDDISPAPFYSVKGIFPIETRRFPLLGEIACGEPVFASEDRECYITAGADIRADFCLRAKGNSMTGARINDGDIVFIREQESVENGEIAAVIIDDEATLKRVYYYPEQNQLVLTPENPAYSPLVFTGERLNEIRILGKAVAFQSAL